MKKAIDCPLCGQFVFYANVVISSASCKCKRCNKIVTYNGENGKITTSDIPARQCASGMRFY